MLEDYLTDWEHRLKASYAQLYEEKEKEKQA
jgi:hypothetical protein